MLTRRLALTAALFGSFALPVSAFAEEITVFAAASLKNALDSIAADWQKETGNSVVISYESTAKLAKQIEQSAPADLFISASKKWMDTLFDENLIQKDSRKDILGNTLVLVAAGKAAPVEISKDLDLKALLGDGKLSMATVDSVPAGQYGKEALESLGLWASIEANVAQSDNVRAALALVAAGEAPYGVVYASDAIADDANGDKVTVVGTFPAGSHSPIVYLAAIVASSTKPAAQAFLDALSTEAAAAVFTAQGFTVLK
ncbi:molybdate ABC transporter substrate-binding protein [Cypionkella sp.]|uniref:molybdate ABC transporter substrate-binding protein n=1 Tax=Cypionkella sp. TaxID=2811411 RepID=UPI002AB84A81|nr:molybdate ABC transporter substrate-binding protein [Cypionkella sp.]MDZ4392762.1 molybdate ABC transporter substrate-binding protein [Cypionkella sp.]